MATTLYAGGVRYGKSAGGLASQTFWNDEPLKMQMVAAFRGAVFDVRDEAERNKPEHRIRVRATLTSGGAATGMNIAGILMGKGLAPIFEQGAKPHTIAPRRSGGSRRRTGSKVLAFPDGGFASGPVQHPGMKAQPFMGPASSKAGLFFAAQAKRRLSFGF